MLSKAYHTLAIVAIATLLAGGGIGAYLFGAGRLNAQRIESIAAVLRGDLSLASDAQTAPTTQPAATTRPSKSPSSDEIRRSRVQEQLRRATLERAATDVQARQALLDQSLQQLLTLQDELARKRKDFKTETLKRTDELRDAGFERELEYVSKLSPKLAKEHVILTWRKSKADAVRLFMAINPSQGQRILEQFKAPEEVTILHELLEQIRQQPIDSAPESGKTPGTRSDFS